MSDRVETWTEYGIGRPDGPDMSGRMQYFVLTAATFQTMADARMALRNIPSIRDREAVILKRQAPTAWEKADGGT